MGGLSNQYRGLSRTSLKINLTATDAPTVNDDVSQGYSAGSIWYDTESEILYQLVDNTTGAAVWKDISSGATAAFSTYMFSSTNSDISGYESMPALSAYTAAALATKTTNIGTSETLMEEFATDLGFPNLTVIPAGLFECHYETQKASGSNNYYTYFKLYKRTSGGTETLLGTSDNTTQTAVNTIVQQTTTLLLATNTALLTTDRLVVKIYGIMLSASVNIDLLYDDTTNARLEIPSVAVDATNFLPYTGATQNVDLGTKTISTGGTTDSSLTASYAVITDINKKLTSLAYTSAATASTLVSRDSNGNTNANTFINGATNNAPSGTTTYTLTSASTPIQLVTTANQADFVLPNATTLEPNAFYTICQASGVSNWVLKNNGLSNIFTNLLSNWTYTFQCTNNSTSNGTWLMTASCPANSAVAVNTLGNIGSSPNANGASISLRTLTLQPASASFGGVVSTAAQTFAGQKTFNAGAIFSFSTLTDAATVAVDLSLANNFNLTLGGNRTLGIPTNPTAGQEGSITVRQDSTGSRTLAYSWPYIFPQLLAPTLSTGKYAMDLLSYKVLSYSTATATMTIATPCVVTWTGHGLVSGQRVAFTTTGALPTGLSVNTGYYINVVDANTFNLSTSLANLQAATYIATSGSQSGTHTVVNMAIEILMNGNNGA